MAFDLICVCSKEKQTCSTPRGKWFIAEKRSRGVLLPGIGYFSGMFFKPISVPASLNNFSSCFTMFIHTGAPAQAFANSSSVLYLAFICSSSGTTFPLSMVFPSWQDSQCLSHEFTDWTLEQPEIKQNAKITIMINLIALGIIHLSS